MNNGIKKYLIHFKKKLKNKNGMILDFLGIQNKID